MTKRRVLDDPSVRLVRADMVQAWARYLYVMQNLPGYTLSVRGSLPPRIPHIPHNPHKTPPRRWKSSASASTARSNSGNSRPSFGPCARASGSST
ncbi:MAG: hypothetical protein ACRDPY_29715, partial [Streptosporangiaceae bacterium]